MRLKANTINISCKLIAVLTALICLILKAKGTVEIPMSEVVMVATFIAAAFVGVDISKVGVAIRRQKEGDNEQN
jgi:Na+/H+-dicarboxylate symporter